MLDANALTITDIYCNGNIVNTNLTNQLNNKSDINHTHSIGDITSGILPISLEGTESNNSEMALADLNLRTFSFTTGNATRNIFLFSVEAWRLHLVFDIFVDRNVSSDIANFKTIGTVIF